MIYARALASKRRAPSCLRTAWLCRASLCHRNGQCPALSNPSRINAAFRHHDLSILFPTRRRMQIRHLKIQMTAALFARKAGAVFGQPIILAVLLDQRRDIEAAEPAAARRLAGRFEFEIHPADSAELPLERKSLRRVAHRGILPGGPATS